MRSIFFVVALVLSIPGFGRDFVVSRPEKLDAVISAAEPGDIVILQPGEWRHVQIRFEGQGTSEAPITLRSETPGSFVLTGSSTLRIGGAHLVVDGIFFKDPDPTVSDLIEFRLDSKRLAEHCRLTNCKIVNSHKNDESHECRWLGVYGRNNRVDHCSLQGKSGKGATFVVWLGDENRGAHTINHNYFGPREKLGKNGGETIRIGDSKTSMSAADCVVENNLFEKCNGEAECISNKSCGNIYRNNTFLEVSGTLTLRHGNNCLVEDNLFLGMGTSGTGGVRVIGEDHVIRGNYFKHLMGDDLRSAICLMMGIPDSPLNRYFQVQRARIENNTIIDCQHPILIGLSDDKKATLAPSETVFDGNRCVCPKSSLIEARCELAGITWKNNHMTGKQLGLNKVPDGILFNPKPDEQPASEMRVRPIQRSNVGVQW